MDGEIKIVEIRSKDIIIHYSVDNRSYVCPLFVTEKGLFFEFKGERYALNDFEQPQIKE